MGILEKKMETIVVSHIGVGVEFLVAQGFVV